MGISVKPRLGKDVHVCGYVYLLCKSFKSVEALHIKLWWVYKKYQKAQAAVSCVSET